MELPADAVLTPLPIDDDYYDFFKRGRLQISGVTVLDTPYLIPFKVKARLDFSAKKEAGGQVDSRC